MDLLLVRSLWGVDLPWDDAFPRIRAAGYGAIEAPMPPPPERTRFRDALDAHGFPYIAMVFTEGTTPGEHAASLARQLGEATDLGAHLVVAHSGRDGWDDDANAAYLAAALNAEAAGGLPVAHETHRGRILYNPWTTARMLGRLPELRLCCDFSHWVVVCERLLSTESEIVAAAAARCIHLHARVGFEEGPQVPDPLAPEYAPHLAAHETWWDAVWDAQEARGDAVTTLTPEYGPPAYLHTIPGTGEPVADLWAVCDAQAQRQAARFARR